MSGRAGHSLVWLVGILAVLLATPEPARGDCPSLEVDDLVSELPLETAFRSRVMGLDLPLELYAKALSTPDKPAMRRQGNLSQAVMLVGGPVDALWRALNDDDHHDEGDYLPLLDSRVIEGEAAAPGRRTFQYFKKAGIGRWWVNQLDFSSNLYRATDGRFWELSWQDVPDGWVDDEPPVEIDSDVPRLPDTFGAWLLVPLAADCTFVEYTTDGEPGGVVGALQFLVAKRSLRATMEGMAEMAREHMAEPHPETPFLRPDGSSLVVDEGE